MYLHPYYICRSSIVPDKQSVSLNMSVDLSAFADFINIFIRYKSKQRTSELSVMATEIVSTTVFSLVKKYSCGTKISINYINVCSKSTLSILFKFNTNFLSCCSLTRFFGIIYICPCVFHNFYLSVL